VVAVGTALQAARQKGNIEKAYRSQGEAETEGTGLEKPKASYHRMGPSIFMVGICETGEKSRIELGPRKKMGLEARQEAREVLHGLVKRPGVHPGDLRGHEGGPRKVSVYKM